MFLLLKFDSGVSCPLQNKQFSYSPHVAQLIITFFNYPVNLTLSLINFKKNYSSSALFYLLKKFSLLQLT